MIGAFHQPLGVLVDTATLATLPTPSIATAWPRVVKYGVALDAELFGYLEAMRRRSSIAGRTRWFTSLPLLPSEGRRGRER